MRNYYNSINNLPIARFALIGETTSLKWLMFDEEETITNEPLEDVYLKILTEYRDYTKTDTETDLSFSIQKQMLSIAIRYDQIKLACFVLQSDPCNTDAISVLKRFNYQIADDRCELEQVHEIGHRASNYQTQFETKKAELSRLISKNEAKTEKKVDFIDYVAELSMQLGRNIDYENMSVRQWIAFERALIKQQQKQAKNG